MTRSRWLAAALLAAAFALGLVVGAWGHALLHHPHGPRGRPDPEAVIGRLSRELDLSVVQRDSVRAILSRHRPQMDSLWQEFNPRFRQLQQQVNTEIAAQLEPGQQRKFEELARRLERMRAERGPKPLPGSDAAR
jgi:hypothetical protein